MSETSDRMRELIEHGSLGTPEAKALRASVPREQVEKVLARAEELRQEDDLAAIIGDLLKAGVRPEEILRCDIEGVRALASRQQPTGKGDPLDPAEIMAEHENSHDTTYGVDWCCSCRTTYWPCEPYRLAEALERTRLSWEADRADARRDLERLAEALAAERAKVQRVEALSELDSNTYVNVLDLRAALAGEGAADQPQSEEGA